MQLQANHLLQGGKYRIIKSLGQGGFGITYLAEQTMMDRKVCIKEFFLKDYCDRDESTSQVSLGTTNNRALMEKYQEKFLKEARMIAKLDHPNIIRIHDVFTENNTAYYVMDYIEGTNLNDIVKQRGALPEAEAIGIIKAVGEGLAYVHERKITHLDVKPGNIMIRKEDGRPVLIDFGMSKQYDESGEQTSSTPIGVSAGYAPLEQYQVGGVTEFSPQTDIYALGATLYRLVTGQVPPQASDVMNEGLPEMSESISESTRNAIEKAMQFRKKDRPSSIGVFLNILSIDIVHIINDQCSLPYARHTEEVLKADEEQTIVVSTRDEGLLGGDKYENVCNVSQNIIDSKLDTSSVDDNINVVYKVCISCNKVSKNICFCADCGTKLIDPTSLKICPKCGTLVMNGNYCNKCGSVILNNSVGYCPKCGRIGKSDAYCSNCGIKLTSI